MDEEKNTSPIISNTGAPVVTASRFDVGFYFTEDFKPDEETQFVENNDGPETCTECKAGRRLCVKNGFVYRKTKVRPDGTGVGAKVQRYRCTKCGHLFALPEEVVDGS